MKSKKIIFFILIIMSFILQSCAVPQFDKKPDNFYYTDLLIKHISSEPKFKSKVMETNFYKEKELSKEDIDGIKNFLKCIAKSNFISTPKDLPKKPQYKIFLTFSKQRYVINIYNEKYISIYPWDGNFPMDYIDMSDIYASYNLFNICKYTIPRG